eukprot:scaffold696_cov163-Ochromonas_danica.AAC.12
MRKPIESIGSDHEDPLKIAWYHQSSQERDIHHMSSSVLIYIPNTLLELISNRQRPCYLSGAARSMNKTKRITVFLSD